MSKVVFSLAVLLFYVSTFSASAAEKKDAGAAKRDVASTLPDECLKVVQNTAAAATNPVLGNEPKDYSVSGVKVTHTGPPPAPADGPNMALAYKATVRTGDASVGTVSVRIVRGGCIVTNYNE